MPLAVARKIEWFIREYDFDYDVQVRPVILTQDQCAEYELPRTPNAVTDPRAARFEARFGEGRTELDALEALHPGELRNILTAEIDRYLDPEFREDWERVAANVESDLEDATDSVRETFAEELAPFNERYQRIRADLDALLADVQPVFDRMADALTEEGDIILANADFPEPPEADEDPDPLFDSSRDYIEQIDRYKEHQGKAVEPTGRKDTVFVDTPAGRIPIMEAARKYGITRSVMQGRINAGKSMDDLFVQ
jgi:hypothetical protein